MAVVTGLIQNNPSQAQIVNQNVNWQADRFINCGVKRKNGTVHSLKAITLRLSDPEEAKMIAFIDEDPENNLPIFMSYITATYRKNIKSNSDFDFMEPSSET